MRPLLAHAAVGVSRDPELLRFPPAGFQPLVEEKRLGSGDARFQAATGLLFTLQAFAQAGLAVSQQEQALAEGYAGLTFSQDGEASVPAAQDVLYGPGGEPFVQPGAVILLGAAGEERRMLITHAEVLGREAVLTLGYCDDDGPAGEVSVYVQHRDDNTVWGVVRACFAGVPGVFRALFGKKNEGAAEGERFLPVLDALHPASGLAAAVVSAAAATAADSAGEVATDGGDEAAVEAEELTAEELADAEDAEGAEGSVELTVEEVDADSAAETSAVAADEASSDAAKEASDDTTEEAAEKSVAGTAEETADIAQDTRREDAV